ncbi:MAG TPA: class I SAM-dependent methyltransferase [Bordetella sp.]
MGATPVQQILDGYAEAATPALIARIDSLDAREIYAPVLDLLPAAPVNIADIGAGTGRDAAWFAEQGHHVWAVEPVEALREAGRSRHRSDRITWLDDRLPHLAEARMHGPFGSLRHGPGAPDRPAFPISPQETITASQRLGFTLVRQVGADSVQPGNQTNGVRWTWLALSKSG